MYTLNCTHLSGDHTLAGAIPAITAPSLTRYEIREVCTTEIHRTLSASRSADKQLSGITQPDELSTPHKFWRRRKWMRRRVQGLEVQARQGLGIRV